VDEAEGRGAEHCRAVRADEETDTSRRGEYGPDTGGESGAGVFGAEEREAEVDDTPTLSQNDSMFAQFGTRQQQARRCAEDRR